MPFKFGYNSDYIKLWSSTVDENREKSHAVISFSKDYESLISLSIKWAPIYRGSSYVRCVRTLKEQKPIRRFDFIEDAHRQVVLDKGTSLMLQNEPYTQREARLQAYNRSHPESKELGKVMTVEHALEYCDELELGGYDDWYLPNILQLMQIYKHFEYPPKKSPFTLVPFEEENDYFFYNNSTAYGDYYPDYTRCVRDAKVWNWDEE